MSAKLTLLALAATDDVRVLLKVVIIIETFSNYREQKSFDFFAFYFYIHKYYIFT